MEVAPCVDKCPISLPVPDYIRLTSEGRFESAYSLIFKEACIPSLLGRICFHPCEDSCRRKDIDKPLSICNIKRFLGDNDFSIPKPRIFQKERIAIVGGGPSGLSCAWHLLQKGYGVDIFEKEEFPGGMPYITIPTWRLPLDVVRKEMDNLVNIGFSIKTNKMLGRDFSVSNLKEYSAIVIALGLPESKEIPKINGDNVLPGLTFLNAIKFKREVSIGKRVLVIGGGNVAIDCARGARRMGKDVSITSLEDYENMPCFEREKKEAEIEGIKIFGGYGPKALIRKDKEIELVVMKVLSIFDKDLKFSPVFNENETKTFNCDTIIMAIGQTQDFTILKDGGITRKLSEEGDNGLFGCGDIVNGPTNVASSIASGKRCANFIDGYFKKEKTEEVLYTPIEPIPPDVIPFIAKQERKEPKSLELKERISSFKEIEKTYTIDNVLLEASRCLYCGKGPKQEKERCALCLTCIRICPLGGIKLEENRAMPSSICQGCYICASLCPDNAIRKEETLLLEYPKEVTITCFNDTQRDAIRIRCVLSLGIPFFLSLLDKGVEKIIIKPCKDSCFVPYAKPYVEKMIDRLKVILEEIGNNELTRKNCNVIIKKSQAKWSGG